MANKRPSVIGGLKLTPETTSPPVPAASPSNVVDLPVASSRKPRSDVQHTSIYLPKPVSRKLKEIAFTTDQKVHDLILEGINEVLRKYGHPLIAELKASAKTS